MSYSTGAELSKKHKYSEKEALEKIYRITARGGSGYVCFPLCLVGKKIKISEVKENGNTYITTNSI